MSDERLTNAMLEAMLEDAEFEEQYARDTCRPLGVITACVNNCEVLRDLIELRARVEELEAENARIDLSRRSAVEKAQSIGFALAHAIKNAVPLKYHRALLDELERQYKKWKVIP